ncbi:general stress protein [Bacillus sp. FSL K6-3431]
MSLFSIVLKQWIYYKYKMSKEEAGRKGGENSHGGGR